MLSATSILLAFWLAAVLLFDIDGFKEARRRKARADAEAAGIPDRTKPRISG